NTKSLLHHPLTIFLDVSTQTTGVSANRSVSRLAGFRARTKELANQFVGGVGWDFVGAPHRYLYLLLMFVVAMVVQIPKPLSASEAAVLALVFVAGFLQCFLVLFIADGAYENGRYFFHGGGLQGRYFIPFCLAALLALNIKGGTVSQDRILPAVMV